MPVTSPPMTTMVNQCLHSQAKSSLDPFDLTRHVEQCSRASLDLTADEFLVYAQGTLAAGLDIEVFYLDVLTLTPMAHRFQAMVSMADGSQHTLGPLLVSQYLQRKGWNVTPGFERSEKDILQLVSTQWVDLFCVSASTSSDLPGLQLLIKRVKSVSKNQDIQCLLGGPVVAWEQELQARMGVHGLCYNAREAHSLGLKLVRIHRKVRKLNALTATELSLSLAASPPLDQALTQPKLVTSSSRKPNPLPASKLHKASSRQSSNSRRYAQGVG